MSKVQPEPLPEGFGGTDTEKGFQDIANTHFTLGSSSGTARLFEALKPIRRASKSVPVRSAAYDPALLDKLKFSVLSDAAALQPVVRCASAVAVGGVALVGGIDALWDGVAGAWHWNAVRLGSALVGVLLALCTAVSVPRLLMRPPWMLPAASFIQLLLSVKPTVFLTTLLPAPARCTCALVALAHSP